MRRVGEGGGSGGQIGLEMLVQKVSTSHEAPVLRSTMPGGGAEAMATLVMAYGYAVCSIYDYAIMKPFE